MPRDFLFQLSARHRDPSAEAGEPLNWNPMKWIFGILAIGGLVLGYLYFFAEPPVVKEVDPEKPWASQAPAEQSSAAGSPQADPRKVEDVILQKDYCGARGYFDGGRNRARQSSFLKLLFESEAGKGVPADDKLILEALFERDLADAIGKLKKGKTWQARMILGLMYSGLLDDYHPLSGERIPRTQDQLREALIAFDEAEDLNGENGLIPLYRYQVMAMKDGKGPGLTQFLNDELSKRRAMENPFRSSSISFARMRAQDPLFFLATRWHVEALLPFTLNKAMEPFDVVAKSDREAKSNALRLAESWHRQSMQLVNEGFPEPLSSANEAIRSMHVAKQMWSELHPQQPVPDRFNVTADNIFNRIEDRNPSEAPAAFNKDPCGPKWKEAVDNDTELLRDRLRKFDDLERSRR